MKWIALKLKNLPIIALEIDRAIEVFQSMLLHVQSSQKREDLLQAIQLRAEFKNRIDQLDNFYREHFLDDNIAIFHMLKIKLQRAIFHSNSLPNISVLEQLSFKQDSQNQFHQQEIRILQQPLFTYYESSKKESNADYFEFAKDAPKEEVSRFTNKNDKKRIQKGNQPNKYQKIQRSETERQTNPVKTINSHISSSKLLANKKTVEEKIQQPSIKKASNTKINSNLGINMKQGVKQKRSEKSFKTAPFAAKQSKIDKQGEVKAKIQQEEQAQMTPIKMLSDIGDNQLKFTIKMTKQQYKSLLEMKEKLKKQGKL